MCRQILLSSITSDVFKKHRSPRVLAKHPKKISAIDWYYSSILIRRRCNRFRIIQFGLAGALKAAKSPFEPSNRSSEFSSKLYGQLFLPRGSVVYPRDRCLLLLRIKRNPTGFFRIPGCVTRRLCRQGTAKDPFYFSAGMIAMTMHRLRISFHRTVNTKKSTDFCCFRLRVFSLVDLLSYSKVCIMNILS